MILFREQHEDANVIHIIMGQESDFQFNMSGHIVADITENLDPNKKNILFINRCDSEEELQEHLEFYKQKYNETRETEGDGTEGTPNTTSRKKKSKTSAPSKSSVKGEHNKQLRCPKCLCWGTSVVDGKVSMCPLCTKIEKGLTSKDIPETPSDGQQTQIVEDFFDKKNERKSDAE